MWARSARKVGDRRCMPAASPSLYLSIGLQPHDARNESHGLIGVMFLDEYVRVLSLSFFSAGGRRLPPHPVSSWRGEEAERGERKRKNREIRQVRCLFNFFIGFSGTVSRCLYTSTASSCSYLGYHSITRPDHLTHCGPITLEFGFLWRFSISGLPPCFFSSALLFLASTVCLLWLLLTQPRLSLVCCCFYFKSLPSLPFDH
jgi:hypothetical protein